MRLPWMRAGQLTSIAVRENMAPVATGDRYSALLFDLDGTLTNPKVGITRSVQYALARFGIPAEDLDELEVYIGPPLCKSFIRDA